MCKYIHIYIHIYIYIYIHTYIQDHCGGVLEVDGFNLALRYHHPAGPVTIRTPPQHPLLGPPVREAAVRAKHTWVGVVHIKKA